MIQSFWQILMNKHKPEEIIENLLKSNGIFEPPIPIKKIVTEETPLRIVQAIFKDNTISGFIDPCSNLIYVNKIEPYVRQRFTIAHELGHWMLHQSQAGLLEEVFYRKDSYTEENSLKIMEKEADDFAENLLVPLYMFEKFRNLEIYKIADIFQVTKKLIESRMKDYK